MHWEFREKKRYDRRPQRTVYSVVETATLSLSPCENIASKAKGYILFSRDLYFPFFSCSLLLSLSLACARSLIWTTLSVTITSEPHR